MKATNPQVSLGQSIWFVLLLVIGCVGVIALMAVQG